MIRYLTECPTIREGETIRKVTRYPSGYFVTTNERMVGPFRSKLEAKESAQRAGLDTSNVN